MKITQTEKDGVVCVSVKDRTTAELSSEFQYFLKQIVNGNKRRLLLDLSALNYLRSSVLRLILNAVKEIDQKSGKVVLCCLNGYVKEIMEVNCIKNNILITDSVESGLIFLSESMGTA